MEILKDGARTHAVVKYADRRSGRVYRSASVDFKSASIVMATPAGLVDLGYGNICNDNKVWSELVEVDAKLVVAEL